MELSSTEKPNEFKGIVKTYALINKEVTAEVILTIDKKNMTGRLIETKIINNKGFQSNATICLVDATLTYDPKNGVLKGPIITQTANDNAYCAMGNVTFTSTNEIQKLFDITTTTSETPLVTTPTPTPHTTKTSPHNSTPNRPTQTTVSYVTTSPEPITPTPTPVKEQLKEVTHGKDAEIEWHSDKIVLEVWDDNKIDGDKISIHYNGQVILNNYTLASQPKRLELDLNGSELNIITITAMSEGSEPPNTAMIHLIDGNREPHKILSHNVAGKTSIIRIRKRL